MTDQTQPLSKECGHCCTTKPVSDFYVKANGKLSYKCKSCAKAYNAAQYRAMMTNRPKAKKRIGQKVFFSDYWKQDVKPCAACKNTFPLTHFPRHAGYSSGYNSSCKRCVKERCADYQKRNRNKIRAQRRKSYKTHQAQNIATAALRRKRLIEKLGAEEYAFRAKMRIIKREERLGVSDRIRARNTKLGLLRVIIHRNLKRRGCSITYGQLKFKFLNQPYFNNLYNKWKREGRPQKLMPVACTASLPKTIDDVSIVTYSKNRSLVQAKIRAEQLKRVTNA